MPLALVNATSPEKPPDLYTAYLEYLAVTSRGGTSYEQAARVFLRRWPDPTAWAAEPLTVRLSANATTRPFITFLMLHHGLAPGYDYLLERKLATLWREIGGSPVKAGLDEFMAAATELGFTERVRFATGSQVPARLLIQTGRPLEQLRLADLAEFTRACHDRTARTGKRHTHYLSGVSNTQRVSAYDLMCRSGYGLT